VGSGVGSSGANKSTACFQRFTGAKVGKVKVLRLSSVESADQPRRSEGHLEIKITVEDGLAEIVNAPGSMAQIEQAVFKKILDLKNDYWDKQSRQSVLSRGYQGTAK
jgi:hypothetical protein